MIDWSKKIKRMQLRKSLGLPDKIPADFSGWFTYQGLSILVTMSIPSPSSRKSSRHRVLVACKCGKTVSAGRYHQHKCPKE